MIAIFGANGKTGREIVREALSRGIPFRSIVRDDYDTSHLDDIVKVNDLFFADADQPNSIPPVLKDCDAVVCCIDARTSGWGAPSYSSEAAVNIVKAAHQAGISKYYNFQSWGLIVGHQMNSIVNPFIWIWLFVEQKIPWTMLRVSCYHDEIIDSHVRPPDNGRPHLIHPSSRYSPVSRRDVAQ